MPRLPRALSAGEEQFSIHWRVLSGPLPEREFVFCSTRKWRFDFAWPTAKLAVEIEGAVRDDEKRGRHNRRAGMLADMEKYNAAALLGWAVVRLTPRMIQPLLIEQLKCEIANRSERAVWI